MLHWLPSAWAERDPLFLRIFLFVALCHSALLAGYLFWTRPQPLTVHISRDFLHGQRVVRVLPFVRSTGQLNRVFEKTGKSRTSGSGVSAVQHEKQKLRIARSIKDKTGVDTGAKRRGKKIKNGDALIQERQKLALHKSKKSQKKSVNVISAKPAPVPEKPIKKEPENSEVKQKKVEKVEQKSERPVQTPVSTQESIEVTVGQGDSAPAEQTGPLEITAGDVPDDDSPVVLGQDEYELLQTYQAIHEQMGTHWHPPVGLHPAKPCVILATINAQGRAQVQVEQSSGVLAYDLAARLAVSRAQYPKNVWNQQVRLHF